MSKVAAIVCADIHLCHTRPGGRSDDDWYEAMERILQQVYGLAHLHRVPVVIAGDIFHRYNPPPKLINFAIRILGQGEGTYAVPGQHDQQYHRQSLEPTAFHTLCESEAIRHLHEEHFWGRGEPELFLYGFGWEEEVVKPNPDNSVAIIHQYVATKSTAYPGADESSHPSAMASTLRGYKTAVFGDNHVPFEAKAGKCHVYNCGALLRRSRAERVFPSSVGLLHFDGTVVRQELDCSEDKWFDDAVDDMPVRDFSGFAMDLADMEIEHEDFLSSLRRAARDQTRMVGEILMEVIDG